MIQIKITQKTKSSKISWSSFRLIKSLYAFLLGETRHSAWSRRKEFRHNRLTGAALNSSDPVRLVKSLYASLLDETRLSAWSRRKEFRHNQAHRCSITLKWSTFSLVTTVCGQQWQHTVDERKQICRSPGEVRRLLAGRKWILRSHTPPTQAGSFYFPADFARFLFQIPRRDTSSCTLTINEVRMISF